jgi:hypothetical protein
MSLVIEKILDILQGGTELTADMVEIFLRPRVGPGRWRRPHNRFAKDWSEWYRERQKFYNLLSYLKKQGLVEKKPSKDDTRWFITSRGLEKLKKLKSQSVADYPKEKFQGNNHLPVPQTQM